MKLFGKTQTRRVVSSVTGTCIVLAALVAALFAYRETDRHPRTDDATVRANYIAVAPEVSGKLMELPVKDNQPVQKGDLLFAIDPRPYEDALQAALSEQKTLEGRINDAGRHIAAQRSAVDSARAGLRGSHTGVASAESSIEAADATVVRVQSTVAAASAQLQLAEDNVKRIDPLLAKQYVTVEQSDQAHTALRVAQESYNQAQSALIQAKAQQRQAVATQQNALAHVEQSEAQLGQARQTVDTLESLIAQRPAKAASVRDAQINLERCRVTAPFYGYVTNLNISEGAYARPGAVMFTLIDMRNWYVIANYRETKLASIRPGRPVDVYLMGHPDRPFKGTVASISHGVAPEDGAVSEGLPAVDRTLNWVHLSARFPVRIHIEDPDPELFRIGATAVTVVR
jgi:multidrug efflux system membrane fusion protein